MEEIKELVKKGWAFALWIRPNGVIIQAMRDDNRSDEWEVDIGAFETLEEAIKVASGEIAMIECREHKKVREL